MTASVASGIAQIRPRRRMAVPHQADELGHDASKPAIQRKDWYGYRPPVPGRLMERWISPGGYADVRCLLPAARCAFRLYAPRSASLARSEPRPLYQHRIVMSLVGPAITATNRMLKRENSGDA